ncbi:MAG: hypothetical protein HYX51_04070 [Chloroflexi bacterium]|nr:hypothetical protein [Chloroflexota bacterium]
MRQKISRRNDFKQAGERFRAFEQWERDELISNHIANLKVCKQDIRDRMISYFTRADPEYGRLVAEGLGMSVGELAGATGDD